MKSVSAVKSGVVRTWEGKKVDRDDTSKWITNRVWYGQIFINLLSLNLVSKAPYVILTATKPFRKWVTVERISLSIKNK